MVINTELQEVYMIQQNCLIIFDFEGKVLYDTLISGLKGIVYNKLDQSLKILAIRNSISFIISISTADKQIKSLFQIKNYIEKIFLYKLDEKQQILMGIDQNNYFLTLEDEDKISL